MSAKGEYFIEDLKEQASREGLFDVDQDYLETPEGYYDMWRVSDIPTSGSFELEDGDILSYEGYYQHDDEFPEFIITSITRNGVTKGFYNRAEGDWISYLQPIVLDMLDGEPKLTKEDVDWLMPILRAKIEFHNGLITEEEYEIILNNTDS